MQLKSISGKCQRVSIKLNIKHEATVAARKYICLSNIIKIHEKGQSSFNKIYQLTLRVPKLRGDICTLQMKSKSGKGQKL